jgi:hypothetical protein
MRISNNRRKLMAIERWCQTPAARIAVLSIGMLPLAASAAPRISAGTVQCVVEVSSAGYKEEQTHTWQIPGSGPISPNVVQTLGGLWKVQGQGALRRTQGSQTLTAHWRTNGEAKAQMAIFLRASDGMLVLKSSHSQLRVPNGVRGEQQVTISGQPQKPVAIGLEAFEWALPVIQGAAGSKTLSGTSSTQTSGSVGPMQPGGLHGTARCSWNFTVTN